jgi:hypothetical protein
VASTLPAWEDRPGGKKFCPEHGELFPRTVPCPVCRANPALPPVAVTDENAPATPPGAKSFHSLEAHFCDIADKALTDAKRIEDKKRRNFHDESAVKHHREIAIKALRAAADIAQARIEHDLDRRMLAELQRMRGQKGKGARR